MTLISVTMIIKFCWVFFNLEYVCDPNCTRRTLKVDYVYLHLLDYFDQIRVCMLAFSLALSLSITTYNLLNIICNCSIVFNKPPIQISQLYADGLHYMHTFG